jgi:16S rRNA (uracil1498-N3)-methyltransferase
MPHFFIKSEKVSNGKVKIDEKETYNHISKSLRARVGEELMLIDENKIQYECKISEITTNCVVADILKSYESKRLLDFDLYVAQSPLSRSGAQDLIMEKATELGVCGIYPIFTDNCTLKRDVVAKKIPRWQKIMFEASKQCERADLPTCFELSKMEDLIESENFDKIFAFVERGAKFDLKKYLTDNKVKKGEKVLVVIGPEGGFSKRELEYLDENTDTLSLGNLILKADTAVITAIGNIIYEFEA